MLTGSDLTGLTEAERDNKIYHPVTFDLPILDGGIVKVDLDTAGNDHDILIDPDRDAEVYGTILDNAGAGVVFTTLATNGIVEDGDEDLDGANGSPIPNDKIYTITREHPLVLRFKDADRYVGKTLRVDCYAQKTGGVTEITIDAEHFAGNFYVEAETLFREQSTGLDMPAILTLPNVKIQSNFTLSMANSGDPSTFTFTMDSFPAYTKFDKVHKVFVSIQIIGDENIHPDVVDGDDEEETVEPLDVKFYGGTTEWGSADTSFPGDTLVTDFGMLGNNLKVTVDGTNADFTGNLNRVDDWMAFSSKEVDRTGYYYPFTMKAADGTIFKNTTADGTEKSNVFGQTGDGAGQINMVMAINPDKPVITVYFNDQQWSLDWSKVVFK